MKKRPILYSGPMVCSILKGYKTKTRRIAKAFHQPIFDAGAVQKIGDNSFIGWGSIFGAPPIEFTKEVYKTEDGIKCPYGDVGGQLWVRETWAQGQDLLSDYPSWLYRADKTARLHGYDKPGSELDTYAWAWDHVKWKPSIFMPREASRITLEITGIGCERLQDISDEDAIAEGIMPLLHEDGNTYYANYGKEDIGTFLTPRESFRTLFASINGQESWDSNPWVWVIEFKVLEPCR